MIRSVLIPEARIGVLIGEGGAVKKHIVHKLGVKITVSDNGVNIKGKDAITILTAENVIKAIGRGFSPEKAFRLFDEETILEILELPKDSRQLKRVRSRLIGKKGKARVNMERLTGCDVSIYGKTVAIIGPLGKVGHARHAIEMILEGASHRAVWAWLEKRV